MFRRLGQLWRRLRRPKVLVKRHRPGAMPPVHFNCGCGLVSVDVCIVVWVDEETEEQGFSMRMTRHAAEVMARLAAETGENVRYEVLSVDVLAGHDC